MAIIDDPDSEKNEVDGEVDSDEVDTDGEDAAGDDADADDNDDSDDDSNDGDAENDGDGENGDDDDEGDNDNPELKRIDDRSESLMSGHRSQNNVSGLLVDRLVPLCVGATSALLVVRMMI